MLSKEELTLDGITYKTYEEYVAGKRRRNQQMLLNSGLLEAKHVLTSSIEKSKQVGGIKRKPAPKVIPPRRKSSRLAGKSADDVEWETSGIEVSGMSPNKEKEEKKFYRNRVNDGSNLSLKEATSDAKWLSDATVDLSVFQTTPKYKKSKSDLKSALNKINHLQIDNETQAVKLVPERIYSTCFHPSSLACAGDKLGHVGIWNINSSSVSLFQPHSSTVSSLQWNTNGSCLYSTSYDGTVRALDINTQSFNTIFATYDDEKYNDKPGYFKDDSDSWLQYGCLDNRNEQGYFLSTSQGDVLHLDFRNKDRVTFHASLDDKKINTISLHPNGYSLLTAGLSRKLQLFDIRNLKKRIASKTFSKSVNSAYFSPSGSYVVATTMSDTIDIYKDFHLSKASMISPDRRIVHNNQTGRWLSTFQATWHPSLDIFVVGSMDKPRSIEIFNENGIVRSVRGEMLGSVASRCCFHPSCDDVIVLGGNSSGKVFLLKK